MASSWGMVAYMEFMSRDTRRGVWLVGSVVRLSISVRYDDFFKVRWN